METEKDRIIKAKKDIREFDFLYRKYFPMINNFVYHRVADAYARNEIVSNVFIKAMKRINLFRFLDSRKSSFSSWLYRIAVNEINQYFRNQKREEKIIDMHKHNQVTGEDIELDYELVQKKMKELNSKDQTLIALRYFEKKSYQELAEIYNKKEGTMKVRVHRALKKLRELVGENK